MEMNILVLTFFASLLRAVFSTPSGSWTGSGNYDTSWYSSSKLEFTISTARQLAGLAVLANDKNDFDSKTITLTKDVDLGDHYWTPIGKSLSYPFQGTFDGGSHLISNINAKISEDIGAGLFSFVSSNGKIKNIRLSGSIESTSTSSSYNTYNYACAGGIVGFCHECEISGCINECSVTIEGGSAGGIAGCYKGFVATSVSNKGQIIGKYAGGITGGCFRSGSTNKPIVKNAFNTGRVYGTTNSAGIIAYGAYETVKITNVYNVGAISGGEAHGIMSYSQRGYSDFSYIYNCYNNGEVSGDGDIAPSSGNYIPAAYNSYCRSGKKIGGAGTTTKSNGYFSSTGQLTAFSGNSIINYCTNLVDALNEYVKENKDTDSSLLEWMKGTGDALAVFAKYVKVNFDANSGTVSEGSRTVPLYSAYGDLPVPTKSKAEFNGWYTEKTGGTLVTKTTEVSIDGEHTLYAHWLAKYTVTLNSNGGTVSPSSIEVTETKTYTGLVNASREGYLFVGWFTSKDGGSEITESTIVTKNADHTLYAHWKKICIVTFNANGGSVSPSTIEVVEGSQYGTLPTPTNGRHRFLGWFMAEEGGNKITETTTLTEVSDHILYAHWKKIYLVSFNANGGSLDKQSIEVEEGNNYGTLPTSKKSRSTFLGWFTEGGEEITAASPLKEDSDHTLYAHWGNYIFVKLDANDGTLNVEGVNVTQGKTNYGTLPTPTKSKAEFNGWYTEKTGGTLVTKTTPLVSEYEHTLYAHWLAKYTVTLNSNGGTVSPSSIEVTETKTYTGLVNASREGYLFVGWFTDEEGGSEITESTIVTNKFDHELYAHWKEIYTVTLDANGGNVSPSTIEVVEGSQYGALPTPTNEWGEFIGWYTDKNSGKLVTSTTTITKASDHSLYAHWKKIYLVTLDANGGSVSPSSIKVTEGNNYGTLPTPTKEKHAFMGWFTDKDKGNMVTEDTTLSYSKNHTLYAHWKRFYTVTFETDGGSVSPLSKDIPEGNNYGPLPIPNKEWYEFVGWFTEENEEVTETTPLKETSDHALYAHWKKIYTVTLDSNGGSVSPLTINVTEGNNYGTLPTPTNEWGEFIGWYTDQNSGDLVTSTTSLSKAYDHTLYAHWKKIYLVTLDANGGSVSPSSIKVTEGSQYGTLPTPTKEKHAFVGWYSEKNSGDLVTSTTPLSKAYDHTLYARWIKAFTVKFNANGGIVDKSEEIYTETDSVYGTLPAPRKNTSEFLGWYTAKDGGSLVNGTTAINPKSDHTLYAHWLNRYTVTFDPNGGELLSEGSHIYNEGETYGSLPVPTLPGKKFAGWYTEKKGGSKVTETDTVKAVDHILYAMWNEATYKITFNTGDGSEGAQMDYEEGTQIVLPNNVTKEGYSFEGWYLDPELTEPFVSSDKLSGNVTLYAKWKKKGGGGMSGGAVAAIIIVVIVVVAAIAVVGILFKKGIINLPISGSSSAKDNGD